MSTLESLRSTLERKAEEFDSAKNKSVDAVSKSIQELKKLVEFVENSIISEIEEAFEVNRFAEALGSISEYVDNDIPKEELERIRDIARIEVVPQIGPCRRDFLRVQEKIIGLGNWSGEKPLNVPDHVTGRCCGADSVEVVWDRVEKAMGYHVEMRRPNEGAFLRVYEGSETKYKVSGLCSGTRLLFRVRSVLENGVMSEWSECVEACSASCGVQYLCAEAVSESEIAVTWDGVDVPGGEEAPTYHVEMRPKNQEGGGDNRKFKEVYCGSETMCNVAGLESEEEYLFTVRTMYGDKCISRSCLVTARTRIATPKRFRARTDSWDSINLSWCCVASKRSDCVNYIVEMKKGDSEFIEIYRGGKTKIKKSEIEQDTEYSFRVRSAANGEESEWSDVASIRTQGIPAPGNFRVASEGWDTIRASWDCVPIESGEEMNYILMMKGAGDRRFIEVYRGTDTSFVKGDLKQETEYSFRVRSACKQGGSEWSELASAKTQNIPVPSNFRASGRTWGCADLTWNNIASSKSGEAVSYVVEMKSEKDQKFTEVYRGTKTNFRKTDLKQDTEYSFRIRSACKDNVSDWSETASIKTQKILAPSDFSATTVTSDSISLSWKDAEWATSYRIEKNGKMLSDEIESNAFTRKGLFPDTEYIFRIRTVKGSEESEWGDSLKVMTGKAPDFSECAWKECPDYVEGNRKYSVDDENPKIATKIVGGWDNYYCTIIGNTSLPLNQVTSWSIKILKSKRNDGSDIYVGVAPSDINQNNYNNYEYCGWYFNCYYSTLHSSPPHNYGYKGKEYGPRKGEGKYVRMGDSVGVVMDTINGELSFVLNGVNLCVAYEGIPLDKPLVPCVLLRWEGDSVELDTSDVKEAAVDSSIPAPSNITVENDACWDTLIFSWNLIGQASTYQVEFDGKMFNVANSNSFTKRELLPDTEHTFRVRTAIYERISEWSVVVKGRTQKESFELSGWKECPEYVENGKGIYPISRSNPRIANSGHYSRFIGNTPLPKNKMTKWSIKITTTDSWWYSQEGRENNYIGVAPSDIDEIKDNSYYEYGWYINDYDLSLISGPPHNFRNKKYKENPPKVNCIGVVMDTTKGELSFVANGANLGVAYEGIPLDKPLVPCVHTGSSGISVELII